MYYTSKYGNIVNFIFKTIKKMMPRFCNLGSFKVAKTFFFHKSGSILCLAYLKHAYNPES